MPRIRTIKPEFWDSPSTARASAVARLLFIAMWNWADDFGRGTANLKELEGFAFPHDDIEELSGGKCRKFRDCVAEVSACFDVVFYEVNRRPYYAILKWELHQRNERRAKSKFPGPEEGKILEMTGKSEASSAPVAEMRGTSVQVVGSSDTGTGEQGNRGTGEQVTSQRSGTSALAKVGDREKAALRIVNAWGDGLDPQQRPKSEYIRQITAQVQALVNQGYSDEHIRAGMAEWWEGKYPPTTLPNYVVRAQQGPKTHVSTGTSRAMQTMELVRHLEQEEQDEPF